jgi:hypothetical protein
MDFLRNIASAALQSTGVSFPFTIGERIPGTEGKTIWDIREGIKKVSLGACYTIQLQILFWDPCHVDTDCLFLCDIGRLDPIDLVHIRLDVTPLATWQPGPESSVQYRQERLEKAEIDTAS